MLKGDGNFKRCAYRDILMSPEGCSQKRFGIFLTGSLREPSREKIVTEICD